MSEVNYCKNLWDKYQTCVDAEERAQLAFDEASTTGEISNIRLALDAMPSLLVEMEDAWENCLVEIPHRGMLFGPEYSALERQADKIYRCYQTTSMLKTDTKEQIIDGLLAKSDIASLGEDASKIYEYSDGAAFSDCREIGHLVKIKSLMLRAGSAMPFPKLCDISFVNKLKKIEILDLMNTDVEDLSALATLTKMKKLVLDGTKVRDISVLSNLTNLEWLMIDRTEVYDISAVGSLLNLIKLEIANTAVTDLSPIAGLRHLEAIDISSTAITDLTPLLTLPALSKLHIHNLEAAKTEEGMKVLEELRARGVLISDQEYM